MWDRLKKEREEWLAAQPNEPIKVTLPDGKVLEGQSWKSSPYDIAAMISKGELKRVFFPLETLFPGRQK